MSNLGKGFNKLSHLKSTHSIHIYRALLCQTRLES